MNYTRVNEVKFKTLYVDAHEEYFYKFALDTLIEEDHLQLEALDGDFFKHLYGFILQMMYVDFCNIIDDGGYEYDYDELEYPLDDNIIPVFYDVFIRGEEERPVVEFDSDEDFEIDPCASYIDIAELDEEEPDEVEMLQELIAEFRPQVAKMLCSKYSTIELLYMMYYTNKDKVIMGEHGEETEEYKSYEDYVAYVAECIDNQTIDNVQAYAWIEDGMS